MKPQGTISGAAGFHGQNAMEEGDAASDWKDWTPKRNHLASNRGSDRIQLVRDSRLEKGSPEAHLLIHSLCVRRSKNILPTNFTKTLTQGQARKPYSRNPRMDNRMN
jgi:hypothetical protein